MSYNLHDHIQHMAEKHQIISKVVKTGTGPEVRDAKRDEVEKFAMEVARFAQQGQIDSVFHDLYIALEDWEEVHLREDSPDYPKGVRAGIEVAIKALRDGGYNPR